MRRVILTGLLLYPLHKATDSLSINYASAIGNAWCFFFRAFGF